ncbi:putative bifunctional diguanylate cyclase/phosphodiesterase [Luteimonas sp. 22616]|uniref:putative bifunctional diguanylate cyclase/phosphodiesterase n=1 Tax=Luteimonas sp. 22616 TaxID=3453951 RepID=UPI003F874F72
MTLHSLSGTEAATPANSGGFMPRTPVPLVLHDPANGGDRDDGGGDALGDLVCLAAQLLGCPTALLSVTEGGRRLPLAAHGASLLPAGHALCHGLGHDTPLLLLPDASADTRFRHDPAVTAVDGVRFYLGIALFGFDGALAGTLAVADHRPRNDVPAHAPATLRRLARLATQLTRRHDVGDGRRIERRGQHATTQDPLTGLPDRNALLATLEALRVQETPLGVALLGLDNFRLVNDTLGHAIGDSVLQIVSSRLLARLPPDAHLARFGGDEFAMIFPAAAADGIEEQLQAMLRELARPCEVDHHRVHPEARVGLAMDDGIDASELMARAGLAMQQAKRSGGQRLRWFSSELLKDAIDRRQLDLELRRACRDGEFELHYQPQIDLASGRPTGAEALLRWRHPERGLLMPAEFIDALAHSAVALAVGRWIMQRACRDAAAWPEVDGRRMTVGVNLFPVQFDDERFLDEVDDALSASGLSPAQLELELTETIALRDDGMAEYSLAQLRARGIRVAYDDFGTGHASLSMLHRLPVDRVKIDRSFVRNVLENRGDEAIVRSIALIARNFDLQVVAEGVETPSQAAFLNALGCKDVQGFLYSKAMVSAEFDRWLLPHLAAPGARQVARG